MLIYHVMSLRRMLGYGRESLSFSLFVSYRSDFMRSALDIFMAVQTGKG